MTRPRVTSAVLHALRGGAALLAIAALPGCGPRDARGLVPVAGRITLDGGSWPKPGTLTFISADEQPAAAAGADPAPQPVRVGFAEFEAEGRFVAQTRRPGDGLVPGRYRVGVNCWLERPDVASPGSGPVPPEAVRDPLTSSLFVDVPAGGTATLSLDVRR